MGKCRVHVSSPTACHTQIVVSLVNGRPGAMNFSYSPVLREFTKATNIRLRFLRTNTLLGHLMGKALRDPTVTRRVRCSSSIAINKTHKHFFICTYKTCQFHCDYHYRRKTYIQMKLHKILNCTKWQKQVNNYTETTEN